MPEMLIVDDEPRLLRVLRLGLPEYGFNVLTAANGEEAIKILFDKQVDVVVTDVRMPVMGGVEFIYEMERLGIKLPIVVTTAHADVDTAVKTLKHGACDYIRKPFSVEELVQSVKNAMQKMSAHKETGPIDFDLQSQVDTKEKEAIQKALHATQGVKTEAARLLGISERNLWYKLKKYGL
ncbi:MAG: response regulator [Candidatus Omnitrophica bacterium]|nr:response regulator [Candidatus Omnitrophota bacterium]